MKQRIINAIAASPVWLCAIVKRIRILLFPFFEDILAGMFDGLETLRERVAVCPDCGANRYTGEPCVKSTSQLSTHPRFWKALNVLNRSGADSNKYQRTIDQNSNQ